MQHSQTINMSARDLDAWVKRLWVSENQADFHHIRHIIEELMELSLTQTDPLQPNALDVAENLRSVEADQTTLLAALLSSPALANYTDLAEVEQTYGRSVATLCENMLTLHHFRENTQNNADLSQKEQAEQVRRMLLAMIKDVRAVLIKLSWHLQYLRLLARQEINYQHQIVARQTLDIFAPLANRLGISQFKWELEDLAFRFLEPEQYRNIAKSLADTRLERENYIENFITLIREMINKTHIKASIYGRPKHIYSIWKKMQRKVVDINHLYDLRAIRIIVEDIATCYEVLGMVYERWEHIPEERDDYIVKPKPNGYQSIHTVVIGPQGCHVEIQIRTAEMHQLAEMGVAAHWRYKEGGRHDRTLERVIASLRRLLDNDVEDGELLENFHTELFSDRVFVLTPKGRVIDLVKGATPIDFAYAIHTDIGHRCQGAKVNGAIVPLNYELNNGEQVEILTGKEARPKMNWLNETLGYVRSSRTRQKINHWFRQQNHEKNYQEGQAILEREKHLLNLPKLSLAELVQQFSRQNERDFLIALGRGDISQRQLSDTLIRSRSSEIHFRKVKKKPSAKSSDVIVRGVGDLYTQIAQCCQPVQGDAIIGYITQGRGISVHRSDCPNITHLSKEQKNRLIEISWGRNQTDYAVDILICGYNQPGMLRDVAEVLARANINVLSISSRPLHDQEFARMDITIQIQDRRHLSETLERLMQLPSVTDVQRKV
ncbi:MAG: GTP pyrophosphokinase [Proteobacteria bacterium]|nr:MAG: GTP pyrophosphokinase [Pseudomonadota bacterium]